MAGAPSTVNQKQLRELKHQVAARAIAEPGAGLARVAVHCSSDRHASWQGVTPYLPPPSSARSSVPDEGVESLFGSYDENLKHLESQFGVRIRTNGHELIVEGEAADVARAERVLDQLAGADARRLPAGQG